MEAICEAADNLGIRKLTVVSSDEPSVLEHYRIYPIRPPAFSAWDPARSDEVSYWVRAFIA
jgi:hypothetical protein